MSDQNVVNFTRANNGEMYYVKEVDAYVGMLKKAYAELLEEVESLEKAQADSNSRAGLTIEQEMEMENLKKQQSLVQSLLEQEREERKKVDQERMEFERIASDNMRRVSELQRELEQSDSEKLSGLEQAKTFYEEQIKKLTDSLEREKETSQGLIDEKTSLAEVHEQKEQEKAELLKQIEEIRKKDTDNLQFIIDLQKEAEQVDLARQEELEQMKAFYEEKLRELSESLEEEKGNGQKLIEEKEALKEEHVRNIEEHVAGQEELKKQIAEYEEEIETLKFQNSSQIRGEACTTLFEKIADTAESYTKNLEEYVQKTSTEAEEAAATQIKKAQVKYFNIIRDAKVQAQKVSDEAEAKIQGMLEASRDEYAQLRKLIDKSSREYTEITSSIKEVELEERM